VKRKLTALQETEIKARARKVVRVLNRLYPNAEVFLEHGSPWELVAAVSLSAQSTDKQVNEVTKKLFKRYKTIQEYAEADIQELETLLFSTGFYRVKARNLKKAAQVVMKQFGGKVPATMEELIQLPGVARKTANIVLQSAFDVVVGIPTDTHVLRFARVYDFSDETDPKKVEQDLMRFFPRSSWKKLSYQLVSYGREYCPARKHDHTRCPLASVK
jgi:endonuclease-3